MLFPRPLRKPAARLGLFLPAAAILACAAAGPALADPAVNGNPGGSTIVSRHINESLSFAAPVQTVNTVSVAVTEVVGRLGSEAALYDVSVFGAFGSPAAQAAVAAARAAVLAAGGPGTALSTPTLLSKATKTTSASSSIYSLDPSTPQVGYTGSIVSVGAVPYTTTTSVTIFGPAFAQDYVVQTSTTSTNPGVYGLCNVGALPSSTSPTCSTIDGGTIPLPPSQTDVEFDITTNYLIDTATTTTNTATLTQIYEVDGTPASVSTNLPEPAGWPVFALGLAAMGMVARRPRRWSLAAAASLACAAAGPALAGPGVNTNPGGNLVVGFRYDEQLSFAAPNATVNVVSAAKTEIIARLGGGSPLYDLSVSGAFGSPAGQAALDAARAALLAAGGSGTALSGPMLLSQATTVISASNSIYSLDPSTPARDYGALTVPQPYDMTSSTTTFGPAFVNAAVASQPSTAATPSIYSLCAVKTLPSATAPACAATDGGTLFVPGGQTEITIRLITTYLIDTATITTNTATLTQIYEVDGTPASVPTTVPEPASLPVFALGLAAMGLLTRRPRRRTIAAGAVLACAAAGPALADPALNPNPGGSVVGTHSYAEALSFAAPVQSTASTSAFATELVARLGAGPVLYDMVIPDTFGSAAVQAALTASRNAVLAAGGPGTSVAAPSLLSSSTVVSTATGSIYSVDPSTPISAQRTSAATTTTTQTVFGPGAIYAAYGTGLTATSGTYSLCNVATLPSTAIPTCSAVDGGLFFILAGQTDINIAQNTNYLIDTATTVIKTTTLTQVYALVGTPASVPTTVPEPAGWPVFALSLAATGLMAQRRAGRHRSLWQPPSREAPRCQTPSA